MLFPLGTPLSSVMNIATARTGPGGPISLFYVFTVNGGSKFKFAWHNSTGDITDSCALPNNNPATGLSLGLARAPSSATARGLRPEL
jgi:hypothetical protein